MHQRPAIHKPVRRSPDPDACASKPGKAANRVQPRPWTGDAWLDRFLPRHAALRIGLCLALLLLLGGTARWMAQAYEREKLHGRQLAQPAFEQLDWQVLVPKDWDPLKRYRNNSLGSLDDSDPKAMVLAQQMRDTWDNAPTNSAMDGARARITGYVVPLNANKGELREFLLVPYFGACIHTPPPPANQIIHISLATPFKDLYTMDAVSVSGTLRTARNGSLMGMSGYAMDAVLVERRAPKVF
jgi:hypothetical protein